MEPVIGQIKNRGLGVLLLRGLDKAEGEWALITMSHNLLELHKARSRSAGRPRPHGGRESAANRPPNTDRTRQICPTARRLFRVVSHFISLAVAA